VALVVGIFSGWAAVQIARNNPYAYYTTPTAGQLFWAFLVAFVLSGLGTFAGLFVVAALLGTLFKRDPMGYLRKDIDLFEIHDIQSMALSVHKAMLSAADRAGIDVKLLRAKQGYTTGRSSRVI
jgi:hypothetical protein